MRDQIVREAREWIGTPFEHQHRAKGVAVDCAGLVIGVARQLGLVAPDFDVPAYSRTPDGESLIRWCEQYMQQVKRHSMQPGDVIVIKWDTRPQHLGIVGDYRHGGLSMIHALSGANGRGAVVEHRLDPTMMRRFVAAYALPGVD